MYDTIKLKSPIISNDLADTIKQECILRSGLDIKTGEYIYSITTGTLEGSYDNKVSIRVMDDTVEYKGQFVMVEGSINKLLFGNNIEGDNRLKDINLCIKLFVEFVENNLKIVLPDYLDWIIMRVDYSINYKIGEKNLLSWFEQMNNIYYPRRRVLRFGNETIMFPGSTTTVKFYDKFKEYKKHDYKILKNIDANKADELLFFSKGILRAEVEIKKRKIEYDLDKKNPTLKDIKNYKFKDIYYNEIKKILKVGEEMKICNDSLKVEKRLKNKYGYSLGDILFSTWLKLTVLGYDKLKNTTPSSTFYRHISKLKDAGVSWLDTDVTVTSDSKDSNNIIPINFMLMDKYKVS